MAEENKKVEQVSDRGLFDFMGKKEDKSQEVVVNGVESVHVETEKTDEKKDGDKKSFFDKLHRPHGSDSSSSSDEEEIGPDGEKRKKKKKGLKQKIKEKLSGDKKETNEEEKIATVTVTEKEVIVATAPPAGEAEDTSIVVEKIEIEEEKKGFLEKIKEKVTGHGHNKKETSEESGSSGMEIEGGEKKGIFGKIMDKLPGYNKEELDKNTPPPAGH